MLYIKRGVEAMLVVTISDESMASHFILELIQDANKTNKIVYNVQPVKFKRVDKIVIAPTETNLIAGEYTYRIYEANDGNDFDVEGKRLIEVGKLKVNQ